MSLSSQIAADIHYFNNAFEIEPGKFLPVNRFAVLSRQKSMLIETGAVMQVEETIKGLAEIMNPQELDYLFITHMDAEHCGGMHALLELAPKARIIGNMTTMGKGTSLYGVAPERFAVVFPGQEIDLGGHVMRVEASFIEDGHTSWLFDTTTHTYFSSDAFGAIQFGQSALYAEEVSAEAFFGGFAMWQGMNFNTQPMLDVQKFRAAVKHMQSQGVEQIASTHAPIIREDLGQVFEMMLAMPTAEMPAPPPLPAIFQL